MNNYAPQNEMSKQDWVASAPTILMVAGFDIVATNNFGHHLIVKHPSTPFEMHIWPSTGRWRIYDRDSNDWRRGSDSAPRFWGVRGLVKAIEEHINKRPIF